MKLISLKDRFLLISLFLQIPTAIIIWYLQFRNQYLTKQQEASILDYKEVFLKTLESELRKKQICTKLKDVNVRIFLPYKFFKTKKAIEKVFFRGRPVFKKELKIKNVRGLFTLKMPPNLSFIVEPKDKAQGLVGMCYDTKHMVFDEQLSKSSIDYKLDEYQSTRTNELEFCLCFPLLDQHSNVIGVVGFDSINRIKVGDTKGKEIWGDLVNNFCYILPEKFPFIFN